MQIPDHAPWRTLPTTLPGNITLVRRDGLFVRVGAICADPAGLRFHVLIGFDARRVSFGDVQFYRRDRFTHPDPARLQVLLPDGLIADSAGRAWELPPGAPVLTYDGGAPTPSDKSASAYRRHESWWRLSPLPPAGSLQFRCFLRGSDEPDGVGRLDLTAFPGVSGAA